MTPIGKSLFQCTCNMEKTFSSVLWEIFFGLSSLLLDICHKCTVGNLSQAYFKTCGCKWYLHSKCFTLKEFCMIA